MIQIIAAIVVAVWFFRSARALGKSGLVWAIIGALALLAPSTAWSVFARAVILPALVSQDLGIAGAITAGLVIGITSVGLGLIVAFWIHARNLRVDKAAASSAAQRGDAKAADGGVVLRAEAVHKWFQMGRTQLHVLQHCDLSVGAGEFVAIMGKSGSGKSTLLHILGALDVPQKGQVYFQGQPIFGPAEHRRVRTGITDVVSEAERRRNDIRRRAFGFVFQFYHLLPDLNVLENVLLPRMVATPVFSWGAEKKTARQDAATILGRVGLAERVKHKPNELSGGERQRAAIARALVHKPQILLADEPTGNLDAETGANIMSILKKLHGEGQTIVMVTHDPGIAEYADRVLVLEGGHLRAK